MLTVNRISKRFGPTTVLDQVTFTLADGEHAALIGANGSGKSTLLKIITGEEPADSGTVVTGVGEIIGYLPQGLGLDTKAVSVQDLARGITEQPALTPQDEAVILKILAGLGLPGIALDAKIGQLSGGEQARVQLAVLLFQQPSILLLDEPTNHLDIAALEWLEGFINHYPGTILLVSHDRVFLDRTISVVYELDESTHTVRKFPGNYSQYAATKAMESEKAWQAWKDQEDEIRRLKRDWHRTADQARWSENATKDSKLRRYAKKVAKKGTAKKKRLERYLEAEERVEKPQQSWRLNINFAEPEHQSQMLLQAEGISFSYGAASIFKNLHLTIRHGERVALIGPNGSGKTTLLRVLLGELPPQSGTIRWGNSVVLGYMPQQQETLPPEKSALDLIREIKPMELSDTYRFLHYFLLEEKVVTLPSRVLSHGQRARLLLARLLAEGANFLVLDEPVNHLDIPSREAFEQALQVFTGGLLLVAHDRAFISRVAYQTWQLSAGGVRLGVPDDLL